MTLVAAEAGGEVSRMFEYQLALLLGAVDASSVTLFAEHCAHRAVDYAVKVSLTFIHYFYTPFLTRSRRGTEGAISQ